MTKLLSARDLLEVIRQGEPPEAENMEIVVGPSTLGRRIYNGTMPRRAQRPVQNHPQVPRRHDTVKIESPLSKAQAQALKHGTSAGRGIEDRPHVPQRPSSPPAYGSIAADEPTPTPWDLGTAPTLPPGVVPPAPPPVPFAPPATDAEDRASVTPMMPSLRTVPSAAAAPSSTVSGSRATPPTSPPPADADASKAGARKAPKTAWGRTGEPVPLSKPMMLAAVARVPAQPPAPAAQPPAPVAPAPVVPHLAMNPTGVSLPMPGITGPAPAMVAASAPQQSVASMFSWVTQRTDWAPAQEAIPTKSPFPDPDPPTPLPPLLARSAADDEPRSLQSDERIALSGEETVVLLNYDRTLNLESLAERTGLSEFRVGHVVSNLRRRGVIDEEDEPIRDNHATLVDMPMAPPPASSPRPALSAGASRERTDEIDTHPTLLEMDLTELATLQREADHADDATYVDDGGAQDGAPDHAPDDGLPVLLSASPDVRGDLARAADTRVPESSRADASPTSTPPAASSTSEDLEPAEDVPEDEKAATLNYLAHYERVLGALNVDERLKVAQTTSNPIDLHALAYDKDPDVIRALWDNVNITHDHARFAAFHHRTSGGLDVMVQRVEFFKDPQVQRRILRNPMISEQLLRRMLIPKRLIEI